tara:strand:+ start:130 stop:477 length:348 start_codon:yes stop_codon:yes gene_type:complete
MGLDQYIYKEIPNEYEEDGRTKVEEIHYWRKNYELNSWACDNFCPNETFDFNCERLPLNNYMVDSLIKYILFNLDKPNKDSDGFEGLISSCVYEAFLDCKERIDKGEVLYYLAWW